MTDEFDDPCDDLAIPEPDEADEFEDEEFRA